MGNNLVPNGVWVVAGLRGSLLQGDVTEIAMHEAFDPDAGVDCLMLTRICCVANELVASEQLRSIRLHPRGSGSVQRLCL